MQIFVSRLALCMKPDLFLSPSDPTTVNILFFFFPQLVVILPYNYPVIHDSVKGSWFLKGMINLNSPLV